MYFTAQTGVILAGPFSRADDFYTIADIRLKIELVGKNIFLFYDQIKILSYIYFD